MNCHTQKSGTYRFVSEVFAWLGGYARQDNNIAGPGSIPKLLQHNDIQKKK